jgi:parallel beta-helix repeat protein
MKDIEVEQALRDWLSSDADVGAPHGLRLRVMSIPDRPVPQRRRGVWALAAVLRARPLATRAIAATWVVLVSGVVLGSVLLRGEQVDLPGRGGTVRVVATDGTGDHETISEAVAASEDGDTILLRPGTYVESIRIDEDITLRGDGHREDVVIRSPSEESDRWLSPDERAYAILLEETDAHLETLTFSGPASALVIHGGSPHIRDVAVIDVGRANSGDDKEASRFAGLEISSASSAEVRDSLFRRSDVAVDGASVTLLDSEVESSMIVLLDESGRGAKRALSLIRGNVIRDPAIAIWVDGGSSARIEGNEISGAENAGALIRFAGAGTAVEGNTIRDSRTAIMVSQSTVDVSGNDVSGNQFGLNLAGSGSQVRDNRIHDNTVGVLISSAARGARGLFTLQGNTIEGNVRGLSIKAGTSARLSGNVVCGNETNLDIVDGADVTLTDDSICEDVAGQPERSPREP